MRTRTLTLADSRVSMISMKGMVQRVMGQCEQMMQGHANSSTPVDRPPGYLRYTIQQGRKPS